MGPDYEKLEEICSIYGKANYERGERIKELEEENKRLSEKNKIYSNALVQEKEENRKLKKELERYKKQYEHTMGED